MNIRIGRKVVVDTVRVRPDVLPIPIAGIWAKTGFGAAALQVNQLYHAAVGRAFVNDLQDVFGLEIGKTRVPGNDAVQGLFQVVSGLEHSIAVAGGVIVRPRVVVGHLNVQRGGIRAVGIACVEHHGISLPGLIGCRRKREQVADDSRAMNSAERGVGGQIAGREREDIPFGLPRHDPEIGCLPHRDVQGRQGIYRRRCHHRHADRLRRHTGDIAGREGKGLRPEVVGGRCVAQQARGRREAVGAPAGRSGS